MKGENMNHQPYETWILDGFSGSPADKEQLNKHIEGCSHCAHLHQSWLEARHQLRSAPVKYAPKNFISMWQSNLVLFKEKQKRKQARTLLASFIGGALIALIALSAILLPKFSLISVIVMITSSVVRFVESIKQIWTLILSLVRVAPTTTLLVIGAMLGGWILLAVVAWSVSVWRVSVKKVVAK
jgi:anti-sigma factor RsiW